MTKERKSSCLFLQQLCYTTICHNFPTSNIHRHRLNFWPELDLGSLTTVPQVNTNQLWWIIYKCYLQCGAKNLKQITPMVWGKSVSLRPIIKMFFVEIFIDHKGIWLHLSSGIWFLLSESFDDRWAERIDRNSPLPRATSEIGSASESCFGSLLGTIENLSDGDDWDLSSVCWWMLGVSFLKSLRFQYLTLDPSSPQKLLPQCTL